MLILNRKKIKTLTKTNFHIGKERQSHKRQNYERKIITYIEIKKRFEANNWEYLSSKDSTKS